MIECVYFDDEKLEVRFPLFCTLNGCFEAIVLGGLDEKSYRDLKCALLMFHKHFEVEKRDNALVLRSGEREFFVRDNGYKEEAEILYEVFRRADYI